MANEVETLFYNTFKISEGDEEAKSIHDLVKRYMDNYPRRDLIGYLAWDKDKMAGGVFFSELTYPDSKLSVFLLSPMAVKTMYQGKGIGQQLIRHAHDDLKLKGVNICMTYGDINFYSKVGYRIVKESTIAAPLKLTYPEGWLALSLDEDTPLAVTGPSFCIPELNYPDLW